MEDLREIQEPDTTAPEDDSRYLVPPDEEVPFHVPRD
jgi:hypothetical protein